MADEEPRARRFVQREEFRRRFREGDSYGLLLVLIVVTYALMVVLGESPWARAVRGVLFGAMLLLALYTSHVRGRWIRGAAVLIALAVVFTALQAAFGETFAGSGSGMVLLVVVTPLVIMNRILRHPTVRLETILGAVCAYLLIGIAFGAIFLELNRLDTKPFFVQGDISDPVKYLYFSFVVITTLGFGDLTPRTDAGRVLVTVEALIGQIFLVTLVAMLIGSFGRDRRQQARRDEADGASDSS